MDTRQEILEQFLGKMVHVQVDRPIGYLHGDIRYPLNYGFLPGVIAGDSEPQDVYIFGVDTPLSAFDGRVVGAVLRRNDREDKLVVAPDGLWPHQGQIAAAVHFQEQYFDTRVVSLFEQSCGILPYRVAAGEREYLLVFEQFSQCWSLPKGHMEAGETEIQTALRELWEETGLSAKVDESKSACIEYPISPIARKKVIFFPGEVSGTPRPRADEISRFQWVTARQLEVYLFPDTVEMCKKLIAAIEN